MAVKFFLILAGLCSLAAAAPQRYSAPQPPASSYPAPAPYQQEEPAKYDFEWSVEDSDSGNDFGQQESRDGDFTSGSYYVQLPDGRLQTVKYSVNGDSGFLAEVSYEGEARYPQPSTTAQTYQQPSRPAPTYQPAPTAPAPTYQQPAAPAPVYQQPAAPAPTYQQPAAPAPTYQQPPQTPSRNYQRPSTNIFG